MLMNYLNIGISYCIRLIPLAFMISLIYFGITCLIKRKIEINPIHLILQFAWILIVLSILSITGILGGHFDLTLIKNGYVLYSFNLFEEGLTMATLLNAILFIPYGFLSTVIFKKVREKWIYGLLIGVIFTVIIEFLQIFVGRFVQLDDILMNTLGTYIGYILFISLLRFKHRLH